MGRYLVTGGAGYVGSHLVLALVDTGHRVTVVDNLRTGHRAAVPAGAAFVQADIGNPRQIGPVLANGPWDAVFHFAAMSVVGDSMRQPLPYFAGNVSASLGLIETCLRHGVKKFVFSSTAALFGVPGEVPIPEDAPIHPVSPYGESKAMIERMLYWAGEVHGLRSACLRYFNAAGADPAGRAGEDHDPETHLIPLVIDAALGRRAAITVFGQDYATPDGTGIRDYIHVTDLADAHLRCLATLDGASVTYNLGNGTGHSVLDVIAAVERVGGRRVPVVMAPRRPGDCAILVAACEKIRRDTAWRPRHSALDDIVRTAWSWRESHPGGYQDRTSA
jgi:UDP-glucose 4-epimerase